MDQCYPRLFFINALSEVSETNNNYVWGMPSYVCWIIIGVLLVFSGIFCVEGDKYNDLKDALEKLKLNDASLEYVPDTPETPNIEQVEYAAPVFNSSSGINSRSCSRDISFLSYL